MNRTSITSRRLAAALLVVLAGIVPAAQVRSPQDELPNVKDLGRAVRQYKDDILHAVVAYNFSQQRHDSRWILIELAVTSNRRMTIHRNGIFLHTPDARVIELASQRRFREDTQRVTTLLQNAAGARHAVESYSNLRNDAQKIILFARPFEGVVNDDFVVGNDRLMVGDLFFENPRGLWDKGTYTLTIQGDRVKAELPVVLE